MTERVQVGLKMPPAEAELLDVLLETFNGDLDSKGMPPITRNAFIRMLVKQEAKRRGHAMSK
jgi:hypothetical protein